MKKQVQPAEDPHKGFLALAGEALHVLGEEIAEGKDKVVETATEKFTRLKSAVTRLTHKKKPATKRAVKKAAGKPRAKKASKRTPAKQTVRKAARAKQGRGR